MLFVSKQTQIEELLAQYRQKVSLCLNNFHESIKKYCQAPDRQILGNDFLVVHKAESLADDLRREVEVMMYTKSIFPESRGDILGLLETMDKVPNQAEFALHMVLTHHIVIPPQFVPSLLRLVDICHRCVNSLLEGAAKLFTDFTNATVAIGQVDVLESEADAIEANLTEQIFAGDLEVVHKLLLRDLVQNIAAISDRAENAGDRIRIIVAKRNV